MEPFHIICTSCEARLKVSVPGAIGQILACPKCEGMVLVTPPPETSQATPETEPSTSSVERSGQPWLLWSAVGTAGLVLIGSVLGVWLTRDSDPSSQSPAVVLSAPPGEAPVSAPAEEASPKETPGEKLIRAEPVSTIDSEEPRAASPVEPTSIEFVETDVAGDGVAGDDLAGDDATVNDATDGPPIEVLVSQDQPAAPSASSDVTVVRHNRSTTVALTSVDVAGRLELKLREIDFGGVSLADLVDFVADLIHVPITLDIDAMAAVGVHPNATTAVHRQQTTVAELLTAALASHGLTYVVDRGHVVVTSEPSRRQGRRGTSSPLEARAIDMSDALAKPVTFTFLQPTRLTRVANFLEQVGDVTITIDWRSLAEVDFTLDTEISCAARNQPLGEALTAVLAPLGLAWRAADGGTLEITTPAAVDGATVDAPVR